MTIFVDPRAGTGERDYTFRRRGKTVTRHDEGMAKTLASAPLYVQTQVMQMEADLMWMGNGPNAEVWPIGVEYKKLRDVLQCITTGRFADIQLPRMQETFRVSYLLIEGRWKSGVHGELLRRGTTGWKPIEHGRGVWKALALEHWLATMRHCTGLTVVSKDDREQALAWVKSEYTWWTVEEFEKHRAHVQPFVQRSAHGTRPSPAARLFATLPGIGWEKASLVARHFGNSVEQACRAGDREWLEIPGIGPVIARKAQQALRGK